MINTNALSQNTAAYDAAMLKYAFIFLKTILDTAPFTLPRNAKIVISQLLQRHSPFLQRVVEDMAEARRLLTTTTFAAQRDNILASALGEPIRLVSLEEIGAGEALEFLEAGASDIPMLTPYTILEEIGKLQTLYFTNSGVIRVSPSTLPQPQPQANNIQPNTERREQCVCNSNWGLACKVHPPKPKCSCSAVNFSEHSCQIHRIVQFMYCKRFPPCTQETTCNFHSQFEVVQGGAENLGKCKCFLYRQDPRLRCPLHANTRWWECKSNPKCTGVKACQVHDPSSEPIRMSDLRDAFNTEPQRINNLNNTSSAFPNSIGSNTNVVNDSSQNHNPFSLLDNFPHPNNIQPEPQVDSDYVCCLLSTLENHIGQRVEFITDELTRAPTGNPPMYYTFIDGERMVSIQGIQDGGINYSKKLLIIKGKVRRSTHNPTIFVVDCESFSAANTGSPVPNSRPQNRNPGRPPVPRINLNQDLDGLTRLRLDFADLRNSNRRPGPFGVVRDQENPRITIKAQIKKVKAFEVTKDLVSDIPEFDEDIKYVKASDLINKTYFDSYNPDLPLADFDEEFEARHFPQLPYVGPHAADTVTCLICLREFPLTSPDVDCQGAVVHCGDQTSNREEYRGCYQVVACGSCAQKYADKGKNSCPLCKRRFKNTSCCETIINLTHAGKGHLIKKEKKLWEPKTIKGESDQIKLPPPESFNVDSTSTELWHYYNSMREKNQLDYIESFKCFSCKVVFPYFSNSVLQGKFCLKKDCKKFYCARCPPNSAGVNSLSSTPTCQNCYENLVHIPHPIENPTTQALARLINWRSILEKQGFHFDERMTGKKRGRGPRGN